MSPVLKVLPLQEGATLAAGMRIVFTKTGPLFLADTGVNIQPNHKELAEIARLASEQVKAFGIEPRVAMLSFSSFGGTPHPRAGMVRRAVELARDRSPELIIDGEMRVDCALDPLIQAKYPDCQLGGKPANVLIPPSLEAANIAFNLRRLGEDPLVLATVGSDFGDYAASQEFKRGSIRELRDYGFDLRLAFEDDRRNYEMFHAEGVPCVYIHSGYYD